MGTKSNNPLEVIEIKAGVSFKSRAEIQNQWAKME